MTAGGFDAIIVLMASYSTGQPRPMPRALLAADGEIGPQGTCGSTAAVRKSKSWATGTNLHANGGDGFDG